MGTLRAFRAATFLLCSATCLPYSWCTTFNWTNSLGGNWQTAANWSPAGGPPGAGDFAMINLNVPVSLSASTGALIGLTLENGARVSTNGNQLNVAGTNANTFLFGTGTTGGNTRLVVDDGAGLGFDFVSHFFSMHQGAELRMQGGGAIASFGINVSPSSLISGHGAVVLLGSGTRFDVAGTVRPMNGNLTLSSIAANRLDLDGNIGGDEFGLLDVTSTGNLIISGSLTDSYSGVINIGNSRKIDFNTAFAMDGDLTFTSSSGNRISAPMITYETGATVTVNQAIGEIDAVTHWPGSAVIQLPNASSELHLLGDSTFAFTNVFSGLGRLVNQSGATMTLEDGVDIGSKLVNHGTLQIGSSAGSVLLEDYQQSIGGRLKIELGPPLTGNFDQITITENAGLSGMLDVSLLSGFTLSPGDSFKIINIDGTLTQHFNNLGEGASVDIFDDVELFITYFGGDGNDIVLFTKRPGDFDFDGDVDGRDFLIWQRGGSPNPLSASDLADWQANYGLPQTATATPVPEPGKLMLMTACFLYVFNQRVRSQQFFQGS